MATLTNALELIKLELNENPGSWHLAMNSNWDKLDASIITRGVAPPATVPSYEGQRYYQVGIVHAWWTAHFDLTQEPPPAQPAWVRDIPRGLIVPYAGGLTPPIGWALCDGATFEVEPGINLTVPDLRGRFIVGNSTDPDFEIETHPVSTPKTGGAKSRMIGTVNLPADEFTVSEEVIAITALLFQADEFAPTGLRTNAQGLSEQGIQEFIQPHSHTFQLNTEVQEELETLPPYYALVYLYKL